MDLEYLNFVTKISSYVNSIIRKFLLFTGYFTGGGANSRVEIRPQD